jgi:HlyD family secretion protein
LSDNAPPAAPRANMPGAGMPDADMTARLGLGNLASGAGRRGKLLIGGLGALVLLLLLWHFLSGTKPPDYVTQPVTRGELLVTVSATGTLAPRDQVDVGAEVSGRIDALRVDFNDRVKKGEVLAQINTDLIKAQLDQARATLAQSQATLIQDAQTLTRYRALAKSHAVSPQELDTATADLARARSGVDLAKAQVDSFVTSISKATIRAPIDGVVLNRLVSQGQTVVAAMTTPVLFTLASDLSKMELDVDIDEADVGAARAGQSASFTVDAYPSRRFTAKLISIHSAPKTVQGVVTYEGVLEVDNPQGLLKPGMTATAVITAVTVKDALLVPNGALRFTPPGDLGKNAPPAPHMVNGVNAGRVWVKDGSTFIPRDLKLGASDGRRTEVLQGDLEAGAQVATDMKSPDAPKP